jgi:predicted ribosomally synthesized peptide with nif11-like leader
MSLKNVQLFYERLSIDENFSSKIQGAANKEECSRIIKSEEFEFTQQEFEDYTDKILAINAPNQEFQFLNEKDLVAVVGGIGRFIVPPERFPHYGVVRPPEELIQ